MDPVLLLAFMSPTVAIMVGFTVFSYYRSGMKQVNDYEKQLRDLRNQVFRGNIGHKTFRYMKENLKAEEIFDNETERLANMYEQGLMDELTYTRMKKVLQLSFNEKLLKIHTKHLPTTNPN
jgi:hypothetical protein